MAEDFVIWLVAQGLLRLLRNKNSWDDWKK